MKIGQALKTAWERSFRYKALWLYGLLMLATNSTNINFNLFNRRSETNLSIDPNHLQIQIQKILEQIGDEAILGIIGILMVLGLTILIISILIRPISVGALSKGALLAQEGQSPHELTIASLWRQISPFYWPLFRLSILIYIIGFIIGIIIIIPTACLSFVIAKAPILSLPFVILTVLASIVLETVAYNAYFIMIEDRTSARQSIQLAWEMTKTNLKAFFGAYFVLNIVVNLFGILTSLPTLIFIVPMFLKADFSQVNLPLLALVLLITSIINRLASGILNPFKYHTYVQYYKRYRSNLNSVTNYASGSDQYSPPAY